MVGTLYRDTVLIDSSAVIAIFDSSDQFHNTAIDWLKDPFDLQAELKWYSLNVTAHESFTRVRYNTKQLDPAVKAFEYLRSNPIEKIDFTETDEIEAKVILTKYKDQQFSYHDALCAAVMKRHGILKVFTFDSDFYIMGFEVVPGTVTI